MSFKPQWFVLLVKRVRTTCRLSSSPDLYHKAVERMLEIIYVKTWLETNLSLRSLNFNNAIGCLLVLVLDLKRHTIFQFTGLLRKKTLNTKKHGKYLEFCLTYFISMKVKKKGSSEKCKPFAKTRNVCPECINTFQKRAAATASFLRKQTIGANWLVLIASCHISR